MLQEPLKTVNMPPTPPLAGFLCLAANLHHVEAEDLSPSPHVNMCCCLVSMLWHESCSVELLSSRRTSNYAALLAALHSFSIIQYCPLQTYHPNHLDFLATVGWVVATQSLRFAAFPCICVCYMGRSTSSSQHNTTCAYIQPTASRAWSCCCQAGGPRIFQACATTKRTDSFNNLSGTDNPSLSAATSQRQQRWQQLLPHNRCLLASRYEGMVGSRIEHTAHLQWYILSTADPSTTYKLLEPRAV